MNEEDRVEQDADEGGLAGFLKKKAAAKEAAQAAGPAAPGPRENIMESAGTTISIRRFILERSPETGAPLLRPDPGFEAIAPDDASWGWPKEMAGRKNGTARPLPEALLPGAAARDEDDIGPDIDADFAGESGMDDVDVENDFNYGSTAGQQHIDQEGSLRDTGSDWGDDAPRESRWQDAIAAAAAKVGATWSVESKPVVDEATFHQAPSGSSGQAEPVRRPVLRPGASMTQGSISSFVEVEGDAVHEARILRSMARHDACQFTCGDPVRETALEIDTHDRLLARLGIPKRPRLWPAVMSWPPERDLEMLDAPGVTGDQRKDYVEGLFDLQRRMLLRAEMIDEYLRENGSVNAGLRGFRTKAKREMAAVDPYFGIRFATLLDERSTAAASTLVMRWGHRSADTMDGGRVRVDNDTITFGRSDRAVLGQPTEQSIQLALRETMARGWGSVNVIGNPEFAETVAKHARALNVRAEITARYGPFGVYSRKILVMPTPPADRPEWTLGADVGPALPLPGGGQPKEMAGSEPGADRAREIVQDDPLINAFSPD